MSATALPRLVRASTCRFGTRAAAQAQAQLDVATCLSDLARAAPHGSVVSVEMRSSEDLVCNNLMCEQLGGACVCRLARFMESLPRVERMDLSQNNLHVLPDAIWDRRNLRVLDLSHNAISRVPQQVAALEKLEVLRLAGNSISELPDELFEMPALRELDVRGNPLVATEQQRLAAAEAAAEVEAVAVAEAEARVDSNMDASVDEVVCGNDAGSSASVLRVLWRGACDEPAL